LLRAPASKPLRGTFQLRRGPQATGSTCADR
jgi:hypothetical protein